MTVLQVFLTLLFENMKLLRHMPKPNQSLAWPHASLRYGRVYNDASLCNRSDRAWVKSGWNKLHVCVLGASRTAVYLTQFLIYQLPCYYAAQCPIITHKSVPRAWYLRPSAYPKALCLCLPAAVTRIVLYRLSFEFMKPASESSSRISQYKKDKRARYPNDQIRHVWVSEKTRLKDSSSSSWNLCVTVMLGASSTAA